MTPPMTITTEFGVVTKSLQEWYHRHLELQLQRQQLPLLDLQSPEDFGTRHLEGSIHIPLADVKQRSYELPPRQDAFCILVPAKEEEQALHLIRDYLLDYHHPNCDIEDEDPKRKKRRRAQKPWNIPMVILASDHDNWKQAQELGILVTASDHNTDSQNNNTGLSSTATTAVFFQPRPRLWKPDPMIQMVLLPLVAKELQEIDTTAEAFPMNNASNNTVYEIWDLGAGSGRDVCFFAEELKAILTTATNAAATEEEEKQQPSSSSSSSMEPIVQVPVPKFCVVAMDQRYRSLTTEECILFWKRRGVGDVTRCVSVQWGNYAQEKQHEHGTWFQEQKGATATTEVNESTSITTCTNTSNQQDAKEPANERKKKQILCIYLVRFWNVSLMEFLSQSSLVDTGTLIAVSQFAKPYAGASWTFEHPKVRACFMHSWSSYVTLSCPALPCLSSVQAAATVPFSCICATIHCHIY